MEKESCQKLLRKVRAHVGLSSQWWCWWWWWIILLLFGHYFKKQWQTCYISNHGTDKPASSL
jgi:hypothetical protein